MALVTDLTVSPVNPEPCWCDGDTTTGGHWHDPVVVSEIQIAPDLYPTMLNAILDELKAIRALIEKNA